MSFLQFLRSGQRDLDRFCETRRRCRFPTIQIYPKGFVPPHYSRVLKPLAPDATGEGVRNAPNGAGGEEVENPARSS
jgi:hypothetical protein